MSLPNAGLHTVRTLAGAGVIYGAASVAHGSGFLAVFVAGLIVGDAEAPFKREIELFQNALSNTAEIVVFVGLGLTIELGSITGARWVQGLVLAVFLAFAARPLVVGVLLLPVRLRVGERLFVMWGGLKGAVPILLAAFALIGGVDDGPKIYNIVFIVVLFSVVVQGASIPFAAAAARRPDADVSVRAHRGEDQGRMGSNAEHVSESRASAIWRGRSRVPPRRLG